MSILSCSECYGSRMARKRSFQLVIWFWLFFACVSAAAAANDVAAGAESSQELAQRYQQYFRAGDTQKLRTLVFWLGVMDRERAAFDRSLRFDLQYKLASVSVSAMTGAEVLEYKRDGVIYRPTLPPAGRLTANYEGHGETKAFSTTYLIGVSGHRYYIVLASPAKK